MGKLESALEKALKTREKENANEESGPFVADDRVDESASEKVPEIEPGGMDDYEIKSSIRRITNPEISENLVVIKNPLSHVAEEYRKLRTTIFEATEGTSANTILVTSSMSGEGKSLTSANLAASISLKSDHSVLLIDADLRRPTLHKYFNLTPEKGLIDYLRGEAELDEVLLSIDIGNMLLLPAGKPTANPVELLTSNRMQDLMQVLKNQFSNRYVIIDSTPLMSTAEPVALASKSDGVLFVVRERQVGRKDVQNALALLKGAKILGVILNADDDSSNGRYYYYY